VRIGEHLEDVHRALGTPKLSDAAMGGKLLEVWRSGPAFEGRRQNGVEQLQIYFRREGADLSGAIGRAADPGDFALFLNTFGNFCKKQFCAGLGRVPEPF
jgi:hypothetical protein